MWYCIVVVVFLHWSAHVWITSTRPDRDGSNSSYALLLYSSSRNVFLFYYPVPHYMRSCGAKREMADFSSPRCILHSNYIYSFLCGRVVMNRKHLHRNWGKKCEIILFVRLWRITDRRTFSEPSDTFQRWQQEKKGNAAYVFLKWKVTRSI